MATGDLPSLQELTEAMPEGVLPQLRGVAKAIYTAGHFVALADGKAVFALANGPTRDRAEKIRGDVEAALATHFGRPVPLRLVEEGQAIGGGAVDTAAPAEAAPAPPPAPEDDVIAVAELTDATDHVATGAEKLTQAFPGAVLVDEETAP